MFERSGQVKKQPVKLLNPLIGKSSKKYTFLSKSANTHLKALTRVVSENKLSSALLDVRNFPQPFSTTERQY